MKNSDRQERKKQIGRIGLFLLIVFLPAAVVEVLLAYAGVQQQWLHIMILTLMMVILFLLYSFILAKMDQRKQERMKKKKDPFAD